MGLGPAHSLDLLRVTGYLNGHPATFLIDCGASNDFVDTAFIARHSLDLLPTDRYVRGYDGAARPAAGILRGAPFLASQLGRAALADPLKDQRPFTAVELAGEDAILGLPWLRSVSPSIDWETAAVHVRRGADTHTLTPAPARPARRLPPSPAALSKSVALSSLLRKFKGIDSEASVTDIRIIDALRRGSAPPGAAPFEAADPVLDPLRAAVYADFPSVFPDDLPAGLPPARSVDHEIILKPGAQAPSGRAIRYSRADDAGIADFVKENLAKGFIKVSQSNYSAMPFQVSKKGTDERRTVVDFRALNEQTVKSKYPLPRADELFDRLHGALYFSKLDLRTGFHQIRIMAKDTHKTAFRTASGLYEYLVLAMGLCNAPGTFMQLMNDTFSDYLNKFVLVFLDDIIIYSNSLEEHKRHVALVLARLKEAKLYAKKSKCTFFQREVEFLGHYVGTNGLRVMDDKLAAVASWPVPARVRDVRAFLGLTGFYRRFVRGYSEIALPLTALTRTVTGGPFVWGAEAQRSFLALKEALQVAPVLQLPDPSLPFVLHTDASGFAVGAVLEQDQGKGLLPVAYMSKKMNSAETRYPVHEQELLAIVEAMSTWTHYLKGAAGVRVLTDHKSLTFFQTQPMLSGRQVRWMEVLSQFDYTIEYVRGATNVVADALSRRVDLLPTGASLERAPAFVDPSAQPAPPPLPLPAIAARMTADELRCCRLLTCSSASLVCELEQLAAAESVLLSRQAAMRTARARERAIEAAERCRPPEPGRPAPDKDGVRTMPSQRCTANNKRGTQCGSRTTRGQHCWTHLKQLTGLRVKASGVALAGLGLWAMRDIAAGAAIADYTGDYLVPRLDSTGGQYALQIKKSLLIDAARTNSSVARFANDPRGSGHGPNASFVLNTAWQTGRLKASRKIKAGEEIFVSYGQSYWSASEPAGARKQRHLRQRMLAAEEREGVARRDVDIDLTAAEECSFGAPLAALIQSAAAASERYQRALYASRGPDDPYCVVDGLLFFGDRLCVPGDDKLKTALMREAHDAATGGHLGKDKMQEQLRRRFYWVGMDDEVRRYVVSCDACQRNKPSQQAPMGELRSLPIPSAAWHTVSMDLITALPRSASGHDAIVVFVCKLTRAVHYTPCLTAISAPQLAELFLRTVVRAHSLPSVILSDRDPRFTASFWRSLWAQLGTTLHMSTAYHPQTDGQTENSNKTLENVLRSVVDFKQTNWDTALAAAELAVNSSKNATTGYSPFFLCHGFEPRLPLDTALAQLEHPSSVPVNAAASAARTRWCTALATAQENIRRAQLRQAHYANQSRRAASFAVGDRVLLSSANLRLMGDAQRARKLTSRFIGPFTITHRVGLNAYTLALPPSLRIHPTVNVSQLRQYHDGTAAFPHRAAPQARPAPESLDQHGVASFVIERVLDKRPGRGRRSDYFLVKWEGYPVEESTWEPATHLADAQEAIAEFEAAPPLPRRSARLASADLCRCNCSTCSAHASL